MYRCSYCPRQFANPIGVGTHIGKVHRSSLDAAFFNDSYTATADFEVGGAGSDSVATGGLSPMPLLGEEPDGGYHEDHEGFDDFLGEVGGDAADDGEAQAPNSHFVVGPPPAWTATRVIQGAS